MYQIDIATASPTQPPSTAAGTAGFFTDGNPGTGVPATIVPAEFLNMLMLEVVNAVKGAGLSLNKGTFNQLQQAMKRYTMSSPVLVDTGSAANVYSAVNASPLVLADLVTGLMQRVQITNANTGAATYSPDGVAAKPIYGLALQALQGGELVAGSVATMVYSATANGNSGAWILLHCPGGALQVGVATASRHALSQAQGDARYLVGQVITAASDPTFANNSNNPPSTGWVRGAMSAIAAAAGFASSLGTNGYVKLPSWLGGVVFQWGTTAVVSTTSTVTVTLPLTFPNKFGAVVPIRTNSASSQRGDYANISSLSAFSINNGSPDTSCTYLWFAIGY